MTLFNDILVPTDYAAPADAALRLAARLARAARGRLLVAHVVAPAYALSELIALPSEPEWLVEERARLEAHVRARLEQDGDAPAFSVTVEPDTPFLGIVRLAAERKVDLIVVGTHGRSGLKRLALGSVAERVVRCAPCPVLTVHADVDAHPASADVPRHSKALVAHPGSVAELMHRSAVTIEAGATLADARRLLGARGVRHLPVLDGGKLVGILSDADLGPHVGYLANTKVSAAMTADPTTIAPNADAAVAARLMLERKIRALPVTDGQDVVGVVSVSDVLEEYVRAARR